MGNRASEQEDDQRGKIAKKKTKSTALPGTDDGEDSSRAPSRVHIFKGKSPPDGPSKSNGGNEPLRFSSPGVNQPIGSARTATFAGVQPPIVDFSENLVWFNQQIQRGKKAIYDAAMKAEHLEAIMQGLQRTRERIFKKRK